MSIETFMDGRVTMLLGDVRAMLKTLPDDHFDCVVTSPPYWGLRDYGVDGQIGLEPTLGEHLAVMVAVFREIRRVLKPTGVCWLNYGDCYATAPNGRSAADYKARGDDDRTFRDKPFSTVGPIHHEEYLRAGRSANLGNTASDGARRNNVGPIFDPNHRQVTSNQRNRGHGTAAQGGRIVAGGCLKSKDLCLVPERLFIALQDDGWWIRSKLPWIKRNGMPESVSDRPANSLEQVALLTKSERYWYDADAVRKKASPGTNARVAQNVAAQSGSDRANGGTRRDRPMKAVVRQSGIGPKSVKSEDSFIKAKHSFHAGTNEVLPDRNFRNTDLFFSSIEAPFGLISDADATPLAIDANPFGFTEAHFATFAPALIEPMIKAGCPEGGEGSGTTAMVAVALKRRATLIELNPEYAKLARARIEAAFMGKEEGARHMMMSLGKVATTFGPGSLFAGLEVKLSASSSETPVPEPAESIDPGQIATGGPEQERPLMEAKQPGEQDVGETMTVSARAVSSPAERAPVDPDAVEGAGEDARGHAPPAFHSSDAEEERRRALLAVASGQSIDTEAVRDLVGVGFVYVTRTRLMVTEDGDAWLRSSGLELSSCG